MIVVDVGNSRLKWAPAEGGRLVGPSRGLPTADLDAAVATFLGALPADPGRILIADVAGMRVGALTEALEARQLVVERAAVAAECCGLRCGYTDPTRLGVDRWVAAIAAFARVGGAVAVVDAGTTVTVDAVAADGRHLGGLIFVGPALAARALRDGTARIGATEPVSSRPAGLAVLGRDTGEAVGHAAQLAVAAGVDRSLAIVAAELGPLPVILTGGGAPQLRDWLETDVQVRADLVLEGLALIANEHP